MKCYVMHRKGTFFVRTSSANQCKDTGHARYNYKVSVVFSSNSTLDKDKFLIDHTYIHNVIDELKLEGSCEEMHIIILDAIQTLFSSRKVKADIIKVNISPFNFRSPEIEPDANLTHIWVKSAKHNHLLQLV